MTHSAVRPHGTGAYHWTSLQQSRCCFSSLTQVNHQTPIGEFGLGVCMEACRDRRAPAPALSSRRSRSSLRQPCVSQGFPDVPSLRLSDGIPGHALMLRAGSRGQLRPIRSRRRPCGSRTSQHGPCGGWPRMATVGPVPTRLHATVAEECHAWAARDLSRAAPVGYAEELLLSRAYLIQGSVC